MKTKHPTRNHVCLWESPVKVRGVCPCSQKIVGTARQLTHVIQAICSTTHWKLLIAYYKLDTTVPTRNYPLDTSHKHFILTLN